MGACVSKRSDEHSDINRKLRSVNDDSSDDLDDNQDKHHENNLSTEIVYDCGSANDIHCLSSESKGSRKNTSENHIDGIHNNKTVEISPFHQCWSIGCNKNGAQGNGTKHNVMHLKKMTTLPENININNIITGNCGSTYLICDNNTKLFVWGHNEYGSISMDISVIHSIIKVWNLFDNLPKIIMDLLLSYIDKIGSFKQSLKPCYIYNHSVKSLSSGIASFHKFLISSNNEIYGIGKNGWNQLGIMHNHRQRNIHHCVKINYFTRKNVILKQISTAAAYSIFLSNNGDLYSCGKGKYGGLGLGKNLSWTDGVKKIANLKCKIINIACG